ncbi:MAG: hypothetical protein ABRQ37_22560 [Candidatus Eremiobacterota bacterium]
MEIRNSASTVRNSSYSSGEVKKKDVNQAIRDKVTIEGHDKSGQTEGVSLPKEGIVSKTLNNFLSVPKNYLSLPNFIYPSIENATEAEAKVIMEALEAMPIHDRISADRILVVDKLEEGVLGTAGDHAFEKVINLLKSHMGDADKGRALVWHETAHTSDYQTGLLHIDELSQSGKGPWGKGPFITDYASTNQWEDFADSVEESYKNPENLKSTCPEKFNIIQERNKPTLQDKLFDNTAFKETGKFITEQIDKIPGGRHTFDAVRNLIGPFEFLRGTLKCLSKDELKQAQGQLTMTAGICFTIAPLSVAASFMGPIGVGLTGASAGLTKAVEKGEITAEQANRAASHVLCVLVGPLALAIYGVEKTYKGIKYFITGKKTEEKKLNMAVADGIAFGSGIGSAAGSMAGTWAGCQAGYAIGGPVGGVAGLILGGIAGFSLGNSLGSMTGKGIGKLFTSDEKKEIAPVKQEPVSEPGNK